jgi:hypothetical protein
MAETFKESNAPPEIVDIVKKCGACVQQSPESYGSFVKPHILLILPILFC